MMRSLTLSFGEVKVGCYHGKTKREEDAPLVPYDSKVGLATAEDETPIEFRGTVAFVAPPEYDGTELKPIAVGRSLCKPPDQFSRLIGRRTAANRLLEQLRKLGWSHEDRKAVFDAICPKFRIDKENADFNKAISNAVRMRRELYARIERIEKKVDELTALQMATYVYLTTGDKPNALEGK